MSESIEDVIAMAAQYQSHVRQSGRGHYYAAERMDNRGRILGSASATLGAIVGTSIFASLGTSPSLGWQVAAGVAAITAAVLVALATFLNYADRAAKHRAAGAAYGKLRREFDQFLLEAVGSQHRVETLTRLASLRIRMDELGEASPLIPPRAYRKAVENKGQARPALMAHSLGRAGASPSVPKSDAR